MNCLILFFNRMFIFDKVTMYGILTTLFLNLVDFEKGGGDATKAQLVSNMFLKYYKKMINHCTLKYDNRYELSYSVEYINVECRLTEVKIIFISQFSKNYNLNFCVYFFIVILFILFPVSRCVLLLFIYHSIVVIFGLMPV